MSGFAPRCIECGAWRRVLGGGDGEAVHWRRFVTFVLALAAVTVGFVDLQQLRRSDWLSDAASGDDPPAAGVRTARHEAPSTAASPSSPSISSATPASAGERGGMPGASVVGVPPSSSPRSTAAAAPSGPGATGGATQSEAAPSSMASTIADWFERVALGRGHDVSFARDTIDSALTAAGRRARTGAARDGATPTLRSRLRDGVGRDPRNASRAPTP